MKSWSLAVSLLLITTLACVTNTPVARIATPRPTRTPIPTFTLTPIPPSATPLPTSTNTPIATDTPIPTNTPLPTDTPAPTDTATLEPTNTPLPLPTPAPPPPTNTPIPTAAPVNISPIATPISPIATPTNAPDTPPGRYEVEKTQEKQNCFDMGVTGSVKEKGNENPVQFVTIQVTGDDDDYRGPFIGKTDAEGRYNIYIGSVEDVGEVEFKAEVIGPNVDSEDKPEWRTSKDCHDDDEIQIMEIEWLKK